MERGASVCICEAMGRVSYSVAMVMTCNVRSAAVLLKLHPC